MNRMRLTGHIRNAVNSLSGDLAHGAHRHNGFLLRNRQS
jgi:hypothetical protein